MGEKRLGVLSVIHMGVGILAESWEDFLFISVSKLVSLSTRSPKHTHFPAFPKTHKTLK